MPVETTAEETPPGPARESVTDDDLYEALRGTGTRWPTRPSSSTAGRIPARPDLKIPSRARLTAYPAAEHLGLIWVCLSCRSQASTESPSNTGDGCAKSPKAATLPAKQVGNDVHSAPRLERRDDR